MKKIFNNKWTLSKANFGTHKVSEAYKDFNGIYTKVTLKTPYNDFDNH